MRNPFIYAAAELGGLMLGRLPDGLPMVHKLVDQSVAMAGLNAYDVDEETNQALYYAAIRAVAFAFDRVRGMPQDQIGPAFRRELLC